MTTYEFSDIPNELRGTSFNRQKLEYENHIRNTNIEDLNPHSDRMVALGACLQVFKSYDIDHDPHSAVLHQKLGKVLDLHNISQKDILLSF